MADMAEQDWVYEMVALRGRSTGLPMTIWIGGSRIKVQMDHREKFDLERLAVVSVDPPKVLEGELSATDLNLVRRYITFNREAILAHWREETDGIELGQALKPLK